jgi:hypothetical protein
MGWQVSEQAIEFFRKADRSDAPTRAALDRLWGRIDLDPEGEGTLLVDVAGTKDMNLKRVVRALKKLEELEAAAGVQLMPRVTYEPITGPSRPPPWLAFALHAADWPKKGTHTLIAMGVVDRKGTARS